MKKKKKILITGSNGFIGSNLINQLKKKYDVYGIGRKDKNEKKYFKLDIKNKKKIENFFKKNNFDMLIHCAWYTKYEDYRSSKKNYDYLRYSKNILDNYIKNGGNNFIGIGTCEEYKKIKYKKNIFFEESNIEPINLYAESKNEFHKYLKAKKINYKWLRIFYLFGNGESAKRLFPSILKNSKKNDKLILNYPYFKTDFIYVKILTKMIEKLIDKKISGTFNVCSGKSLQLSEILNLIRKYLNKDKQKIKLKKKKLDYEEIIGSVEKIKRYRCYVKPNFKENLVKYLNLIKKA